jgi:endonuclease/exonuclease/phosphatase family metal-dependent hydrolase
VSVAYDAARWQVTDHGDFALGGNDDGWGVRRAAWVRFASVADEGTIDVYSTHWCVSIRNTDDACDAELHVVYGDKMLAAIDDAPAIVAGDFNVFDGFEDGIAIRSLIDHGLVDTLREVTDAEVVTFHGNTWAPPGRIDYVFTTSGTTTTDAFVDDSLSSDVGSDHNPVVATFSFDAR